MAQPFSLRYPMIDGSGNFGSLDGRQRRGDALHRVPPGAHRRPRCCPEIEQRTVPFPPNYDGTKTEPVVLPARIPNLFMQRHDGHRGRDGDQHSAAQPRRDLHGTDQAARQPGLEQRPALPLRQGPDFPTGGQILNSPDELKEIYKTGSGTCRLRATWKKAPPRAAASTLYITSIPLRREQGALVERNRRRRALAQAAAAARREDVSTDDVRIALEIKKDADPKMVMAYLFKNTPLQTNFIVNLTCLIPTENAEVGARAARSAHVADVTSCIPAAGRHQSARARARALKKRIHILEGFEKVFDALDEIIRSSASRTGRPIRRRRSSSASASTPSRRTPSSS
jgi:DNA gyrase subunit A